MILAVPMGNMESQFQQKADLGAAPAAEENNGVAQPAAAASAEAATYEKQLEQRVRELLMHVEGVGEVEVMIVLKSSEEKVYRVDKNLSSSLTDETDASGGKRLIDQREQEESTILTGQGDNQAPILEKELRPEVSGVVISCQGGGSARVQAEISSAMESLFDLPAHKIKVLKRVE